MNFNEYQFLKEELDQNGLSEDVQTYIDNKFRDIEEKIALLSNTESNKMYTVVPAGEGLLKIVDLDTLANVANISYEGNLINNPMVAGDRVSFASQTVDEKTGEFKITGYINQIPKGNNLDMFTIQTGQEKFKTALGVESESGPTVVGNEIDIDDLKNKYEEIATNQTVKNNEYESNIEELKLQLKNAKLRADDEEPSERDINIDRDIQNLKDKSIQQQQQLDNIERKIPTTEVPEVDF